MRRGDPLRVMRPSSMAFKKGISRLLFDVLLNEQGLLGGIKEAGEIAHVGLAGRSNPGA